MLAARLGMRPDSFAAWRDCRGGAATDKAPEAAGPREEPVVCLFRKRMHLSPPGPGQACVRWIGIAPNK